MDSLSGADADATTCRQFLLLTAAAEAAPIASQLQLYRSCRSYAMLLPAGTDAVTPASCAELGCCWSPEPLALEPWQPGVYLPSCFETNGGPSAYRVLDANSDDLIEAGFVGKQGWWWCCCVWCVAAAMPPPLLLCQPLPRSGT